MNNEKILVGIITKAHGLHGKLKVKVFSENWINIYKKLVDINNNHLDIIETSLFNKEKDEYLIKINGVDSIDMTLEYLNKQIFLLTNNLENLDEENNFYYYQLINMELLDENKKKIGIIQDVYNLNAGDIIVVKLNFGRIANLPFQSNIFQEISIKNKFAIVTPLAIKLLLQ